MVVYQTIHLYLYRICQQVRGSLTGKGLDISFRVATNAHKIKKLSSAFANAGTWIVYFTILVSAAFCNGMRMSEESFLFYTLYLLSAKYPMRRAPGPE